jgi:hypothetical protein
VQKKKIWEKSDGQEYKEDKSKLQNKHVGYDLHNTNIEDDLLKGNNNLNNGQTNVLSKKSHWTFLDKYKTQQEILNKFNDDMKGKNSNYFAYEYKNCQDFIKDNNYIFVVFEQHDAKKGDSLGEISDLSFIPLLHTTTVHHVWSSVVIWSKLKSLTLFFNGDPKLKYDSENSDDLEKKLLSVESFLSNKESTDPILKRTVFISYYAAMDNNNILT